MPITHLIDLIDAEEDELLKSINRDDFIYSTAFIVGIGIQGPQPEATKDLSWAYFPDEDIPFYRVSWHSNYSKNMSPDPERYWSLLLEVNVKSLEEQLREPTPENMKEVERQCLQALFKLKIVPDPAHNPEISIARTHTQFVKYSYPVPFLKRDSILEKLLPHLEQEYGIYSRGRFGNWKYEISN